ncbi:MAG: hypothetical protein A2Y38_24235 [Spirochaetes bacterium GWB1_59_5]|nr:MAG: hypothetical protein A2Y38_24235 [Spirochaetes bacterium GWB1_59_5]
MGIASKLFLLIGISISMVIVDNLTEIETLAKHCRFDKEVQLEQLVEATYSLLVYYHQQSVDDNSSTETAQRDAIEAIRNLSFDGNEYFWIHNQDSPVPRMIMHPISPELEGTQLVDMQESMPLAIRSGFDGKYTSINGRNIFVAMNELTARSEAGFIEYDWPKPLSDGTATETAFPKLSYIRVFKPWGWVIGTGIYIDELDTLIREDLKSKVIEACVWLLLLGVFVWMVISGIIQPLKLFRNSIEALRTDNDADVRFPVIQPEELARLAESFKALFGELKESRKGLHKTIEDLRVLHRALENMSEGVFITDPKGCIVWVNSTFEKSCGYTREKIIGKKPGMLYFGKDDQELYRQIWRILNHTDSWTGEVTTVNHNAQLCIQHVSIAAVKDEHDTLSNYVGVVLDITERKRIEEKLKQNLEVNRNLLRELHHRVKNNLTIISSMLALQSFEIQTPAQAFDGFRKSTDRISAMAMVHEDLYMSNEFSYVEMSDYLFRLSKKLLVAYGTSSGDVEILTQAESVLLNVSASIPCGIILNELITNAFKHAFPDGRKGKIKVDFRKEKDDYFILSIADDGIGSAVNSGNVVPKTLGLTLVQVLVDQLKGTCEIDGSRGTCYRIRFPQTQEPFLEGC